MIFVALVCSLPFVAVLATRPVLRRLAVRNATRRPRESLLVIAGSMLATALMTAAFVIGDSLESSFKSMAYTQLGPTDEVVAVSGLDQADALRARMDTFSSSDVDGTLPVTVAGAALATLDGDKARTAAPKAQLLEVDFAAGADFGGDGTSGLDGVGPGRAGAVITEPVARRLGVTPGDRFRAFAYGSSVELTVDRVVPQEGVAGLWLGNETVSYNAFVPAGTIASLAGAAAPGSGQPPTFAYLVSNTGGVESGAARTATVSDQLDRVLDGLPVNVSSAKQDVLDAAEEGGKSLTQLYTMLGSFAVIAGILLLVNIFQMLAEERKSELGMLRAMGLKRRSLVAAFASEGWMYAVVASAIGTLAGVGVGRLVTAGAARITSSGDEFDLPVRASIRAVSLERGFTIGLVIALATVVGSSVAISRFNIIAAIRDLDGVKRRPGRLGAYGLRLLVVLGAFILFNGFTSDNPGMIVLGPSLAAIGLARLVLRNRGRDSRARRPVVAGAGFAVVAWAVAAVPIAALLDMPLEPPSFLVQGIVLVMAAVVLVNEFQDHLGSLLARLSRRNLAVRLGLAYPLARKGRTALTLGQFAIVVFILTYISVISAMFLSQIDSAAAKTAGGFDVMVNSNASNPVSAEELAAEPGVTQVAPIIHIDGAQISVAGSTDSTPWWMSGIDASFLSTTPPQLADRGSYATDEEAYRALVEHDEFVITNDFFLANRAGPPQSGVGIGDTITVTDPVSGQARKLKVIAKGGNDWAFNGGLMSATSAQAVFGERAVANRAYVAAADPEAFAKAAEAKWFDRGAQARTLRNVVEERLTRQTSFFTLMRAFLAVGLVIGVAGIGVIMVRAVRERRRQIGVLRSIGFQSGSVSNAFAVEAAFVAVEGVLIGVLLALVASWSITLSDSFGDGFEFAVPWLAVGLLVVGTLVGSMLATLGPARSASKIRPAVALRITD